MKKLHGFTPMGSGASVRFLSSASKATLYPLAQGTLASSEKPTHDVALL